MILTRLIKKEVIYFFRNKSNVATMFVFPIVLIIIMGFSLNGLMNVDKNIFNNQKVYYKVNGVNGDNKYLNIFLSFKEEFEKTMKLEFVEIYEDSEGENKHCHNIRFIPKKINNFFFY